MKWKIAIGVGIVAAIVIAIVLAVMLSKDDGSGTTSTSPAKDTFKKLFKN